VTPFFADIRLVKHGVTRAVLLIGRYAIKVPKRDRFVRGWLANRSEWRLGQHPRVNTPLITIGHFVLVFERADAVADDRIFGGPWEELEGDDGKSDSWGMFKNLIEDDRESRHPCFRDHPGWRLIDFEEAYHPPWGLVGGLYYGVLERYRAWKWSRLPEDEPGEES
jgi:hypothetical protein